MYVCPCKGTWWYTDLHFSDTNIMYTFMYSPTSHSVMSKYCTTYPGLLKHAWSSGDCLWSLSTLFTSAPLFTSAVTMSGFLFLQAWCRGGYSYVHSSLQKSGWLGSAPSSNRASTLLISPSLVAFQRSLASCSPLDAGSDL